MRFHDISEQKPEARSNRFQLHLILTTKKQTFVSDMAGILTTAKSEIAQHGYLILVEAIPKNIKIIATVA